jgi:site-specific recombinase XerD
VDSLRQARPRLTPGTLKSVVPEDKPFELRSDRCPGLLLRVEPSGVRTYWVQVARGKRIKAGNARILTLTQAEDKARRILVDPNEYVRERVRGASLEDFITKQYMPWRRAKYPKTAARTKDRLERHFFKDFYHLPLGEVTATAVTKWITSRLQDGKAPATVERDVAELRTVLSMAVAWEALPDNPLRGMKHRRVDNTKVRFLDTDEEARLRVALKQEGRPEHLAPMVLLSMLTGLRRGELTSLLRGDCDMDARTVTVRAAAAKGKRPRTIPLNAEAHALLKAWFKKHPRKPGQVVFGVLDLKKTFATLLRDAKITNFWWHALRHHFASRLVQRGVPLNTVRELLGHADLKMTLRYAALAPSHLADAVALL